MEYIGLVFGIFGLLAYLQVSSLKNRVMALEEELARTHGTFSFEARRALLKALESYVGEKVLLELKEDCTDTDIISYGNTKHGSNTILDLDDEWIHVRIDTPKGSKEKLIRVGSIQRVSKPQA